MWIRQIAHLPSMYQWTQAVESRNNKDINVWNGEAKSLSMSQIIYRYYHIDQAEKNV